MQDICLAYIVYCCFSHRSAVVSTKCGQCYTKQAVYASSCECRTLRFGSHSTDSHNTVMLTSHTRRVTWHLTMSSGSYRMGQIILRVLHQYTVHCFARFRQIFVWMLYAVNAHTARFHVTSCPTALAALVNRVVIIVLFCRHTYTVHSQIWLFTWLFTWYGRTRRLRIRPRTARILIHK